MSESQNPYMAPRSDVSQPDSVVGGSIEATLAGQGQLEVGAVMSEAWDKLKGSKRILLGGFVLLYALLFVAVAGLGGVLAAFGINQNASVLLQIMIQLLVVVVLYPFMASVILVAARHMTGGQIAFADLFGSYGKAGKLVGAGLLVQLLTIVGFLLLIVPGIYLSVAYMLTGALIAERDMGIWQAMETSRKLVTKHWLTVFLIGLLVGLVTVVSALFLLIPLIWTLPWGLLCIGVVYRNLVGVRAR